MVPPAVFQSGVRSQLKPGAEWAQCQRSVQLPEGLSKGPPVMMGQCSWPYSCSGVWFPGPRVGFLQVLLVRKAHTTFVIEKMGPGTGTPLLAGLGFLCFCTRTTEEDLSMAGPARVPWNRHRISTKAEKVCGMGSGASFTATIQASGRPTRASDGPCPNVTRVSPWGLSDTGDLCPRGPGPGLGTGRGSQADIAPEGPSACPWATGTGTAVREGARCRGKWGADGGSAGRRQQVRRAGSGGPPGRMPVKPSVWVGLDPDGHSEISVTTARGRPRHVPLEVGPRLSPLACVAGSRETDAGSVPATPPPCVSPKCLDLWGA